MQFSQLEEGGWEKVKWREDIDSEKLFLCRKEIYRLDEIEEEQTFVGLSMAQRKSKLSKNIEVEDFAFLID